MPQNKGSLLELVDVHKSYVTGPVTTEVLRGVRLEVNRGDLLSIVGPSGCGKSTLMNILGLLDRPTSGSYFFNSRKLTKMNDDELSSLRNVSIGFVFQSFFLLPRLTALENVSVPLVYRRWRGADIWRHALNMLERVGMGGHANHKPNQLSGGQQQRVAIARALAGEPAILLADEPTGALDSDSSWEIMELFHDLNASEEATIIIITHDRDIACRCARRARIHSGLLEELTESGTRTMFSAANPS